jgi:uncharacterized protein YbbC (DUF1343 family)
MKILFGLVLFSSLAAAQQITGGFGNANIKDPQVIAAAKYALETKNTAMNRNGNRAFELLEIENAQVQVVAGLNYRVCIKVKLGSIVRSADTLVYQNLQRQYSLSNWTWGKCSIK